MVSRRTAARLQLALSVLALWLMFRIRRMMWENEERWRDDDSVDPPRPLSASDVALGAAEQIAYQWLYDRDVGEIRSNRRRRFAASFARHFVGRRLLSRDETAQYNRGLGALIGGIAYRLRYGLLGPLPGDGD